MRLSTIYCVLAQSCGPNVSEWLYFGREHHSLSLVAHVILNLSQLLGCCISSCQIRNLYCFSFFFHYINLKCRVLWVLLFCLFFLTGIKKIWCLPWQQQIRRELLESQLKVASLQDMSCQLLVNAEGKDCLEAKEKVHVIGNRLKLLLKEVTRHIKDLEKNLDISSSQLVSHVFLFFSVHWVRFLLFRLPFSDHCYWLLCFCGLQCISRWKM